MKHNHGSLINNIPLDVYALTAANKWLLIFESHGDSNRCTPTGETRPTCHMHPTLSLRMITDHTYLTWLMHSNLSRSHQQSWAGSLLPRKRAPDTINNPPADRSAGPYPVSLPRHPLKQWGQIQSFIDGRLLGLPGIYITGMWLVGSILACGGQPIGP
jgi:hypothetical protein